MTISSLPISAPVRRQYFELFIASLVSLYFEILIVRWLAAEVRVFSYFKNLTVMAAFMGLSLGFGLARRRNDYLRWFMFLLLAYVPTALVISRLTGLRAIIVPQSTEYIWRAAELPDILAVIVFALTLVLFFLLTMGLFLLLGQLIGRLMLGLPPLRAYVVNILGSLVGIWLFAALSYLDTSPWMWFGLGCLILLWLFRRSRYLVRLGTAVSVAVVGMLALAQGTTIWSPYYRLDVMPLELAGTPVSNPTETGYMLLANQIGYQDAVNLSEAHIVAHPEYANVLPVYSTLYGLPYAFAQPSTVLIVGAGMGNDVASALRHGVKQIDAVEIDPTIHDLGIHLHPEHPYSSPVVNVIVDDARSYLERTDKLYDMIVFGILDSQTLLSGMSSVRLDNYVYTLESLQQARAHLKPSGVLALTFFVKRPFIRQRLAETLTQVFGRPPIELQVNRTDWVIFIGGATNTPEEVAAICKDAGCTAQSSLAATTLPFAVDDWPYLYLESRSIPTAYWVALAVVIVIAWISWRKVFAGSRHINWHFFLLGAAFLLIEFKIITELALLFGSTWLVNAIAVSAVLIMVLLANLVVDRLSRVNLNILYGLLLASLPIGFAISLRTLLPLSAAERLGAAVVVMGLPLFFASSIFSTSLKRSGDVPEVFSSNFLGSAIGGVLEYSSLAFGIGGLYILGAAIYVASWVAAPRQK